MGPWSFQGSRPAGRPAVPPQGRRVSPRGNARGGSRTLFRGDLLLALGVLGLAVFFLAGALQIRVTPGYAHLGPRFFPFVVSAGLAACGLALLIQALRKPSGQEQEGETSARPAIDWGSLAVVGAALLLQLLLMERAGFVLASTVLFWGVAYGFGSRRYLRDGLIGFHLALFVYLAFTRLLDLNLPGGLLTTILQRITGGS